MSIVMNHISYTKKVLTFDFLNVRQKLGTRNVLKLSLSHSICFYMLNNFCFHGYAQKSHSHSLLFSHSLTLSFTLSRHAEQLLFSCLCSKFKITQSPVLLHSSYPGVCYCYLLSRSRSGSVLIYSLPIIYLSSIQVIN